MPDPNTTIDTPAGDGPICTVPARVRTAAELDALPDGAVVRDVDAVVALHTVMGWALVGCEPMVTSAFLIESAESPLTVLHVPDRVLPAPDGDAVERAARVLWEDARQEYDYGWDENADQFRTLARAALAAAHEPDVEQVWNEGFEAGADFREYQVGPSGIPQDPPLNPYRRPAAREPVTQDDRATITVPRPHVAHGPQGVHPDQADADYLRAAVRSIEYQGHGERLWGSGVTAMVARLLSDAAAALEAPARPSAPTVTAEQVREAAEVLWNHYGDDDPDGSHAALAVTRDMLAALGIEVQP